MAKPVDPPEPLREIFRALGASDEDIEDAARTGTGALVALAVDSLLAKREDAEPTEEIPRPAPSDEPAGGAPPLQLLELLHSIGASDDEISRAAADGPSGLIALAADRLFVPGEERLTQAEVAARADIELSRAKAYWRAMGFADVPADQRVFTEVDSQMLGLVKGIIGSGIADPEITLQMTRVMGRAMASIAAAQVDVARKVAAEMPDQLARQEAIVALLQARGTFLETIERALVFMWRRHLAAEAKRIALQIGAGGDEGDAVVGFADLVGFTALSEQLDEAMLAAAVTRFESVAVDVVGGLGGRVIKMIGDEVMFEAISPAEGVETGLRLIETFAEDPDLPDVRAGLAEGPAVPYQGDLFGPGPNLAHRLEEVAFPGSILVSETVRDAVGDRAGYSFKPVRPQNLKGFGRTPMYVARRAG